MDILRLAGLVGPSRHPGRFFAGKSAPDGQHVVNLVHLQDVVAAIELLLQAPKGGHIYNLCAPRHPARGLFYPQMARELGLPPMTALGFLLVCVHFVEARPASPGGLSVTKH